MKIAKKWIEKVAPVLAMSLSLLNLAVQGAMSVTIDVYDVQIKLYKIGQHQ
jgi:hypothetical protein